MHVFLLLSAVGWGDFYVATRSDTTLTAQSLQPHWKTGTLDTESSSTIIAVRKPSGGPGGFNLWNVRRGGWRQGHRALLKKVNCKFPLKITKLRIWCCQVFLLWANSDPGGLRVWERRALIGETVIVFTLFHKTDENETLLIVITELPKHSVRNMCLTSLSLYTC